MPEADPTHSLEIEAILAAYKDVIKQLYAAYWGKWIGAVSDAEKSSAVLVFRSGLNAAKIARDMALNLLPGNK